MPEKVTPNSGWSRRGFLKAGAGVGAVCLAGVFSCTQERSGQKTLSSQTAQKGFVRPMRSPWFTKLDNAKVRCELLA